MPKRLETYQAGLGRNSIILRKVPLKEHIIMIPLELSRNEECDDGNENEKMQKR